MYIPDFTVAVSAPHHQPSSLFQTWDWHYGNWISEKVEIYRGAGVTNS